MQTVKPATIYVRTNTDVKNWLVRLAKKQPIKVTQAMMAEQIFVAARRLGLFNRGSNSKKRRKKNAKSKVSSRNVRISSKGKRAVVSLDNRSRRANG